jgi:hypothetical protein
MCCYFRLPRFEIIRAAFMYETIIEDRAECKDSSANIGRKASSLSIWKICHADNYLHGSQLWLRRVEYRLIHVRI